MAGSRRSSAERSKISPATSQLSPTVLRAGLAPACAVCCFNSARRAATKLAATLLSLASLILDTPLRCCVILLQFSRKYYHTHCMFWSGVPPRARRPRPSPAPPPRTDEGGAWGGHRVPLTHRTPRGCPRAHVQHLCLLGAGCHTTSHDAGVPLHSGRGAASTCGPGARRLPPNVRGARLCSLSGGRSARKGQHRARRAVGGNWLYRASNKTRADGIIIHHNGTLSRAPARHPRAAL